MKRRVLFSLMVLCALLVAFAGDRATSISAEEPAGTSEPPCYESYPQAAETCNWMARLADEVPAAETAALNDLVLPGTHDSGTFGINENSPPMPDFAAIFGSQITPGETAGWARAQSQSVFTQLVAGIRYFDLRFVNDVIWTLDFRIHHSLIGPSYTYIFDDVNTFLGLPGTEKEIIILDLTHWEFFGAVQHHAMIQYLLARFEDDMIARDASLELGDIWQSGKRLVIVYKDIDSVQGVDDQTKHLFWPAVSDQGDQPGDSVARPWTSDEATMVPAEQLTVMRTRLIEGRGEATFHVLWGTLTPGTGDVFEALGCEALNDMAETGWLICWQTTYGGASIAYDVCKAGQWTYCELKCGFGLWCDVGDCAADRVASQCWSLEPTYVANQACGSSPPEACPNTPRSLWDAASPSSPYGPGFNGHLQGWTTQRLNDWCGWSDLAVAFRENLNILAVDFYEYHPGGYWGFVYQMIDINRTRLTDPCDITPPTTTFSLDPSAPDGDGGWYVSPVTVTLSATDDTAGSGVAGTEYTLNGGPWLPYDSPFVIADDGIATVMARSTDNAGNVEDPPGPFAVRVDRSPPVADFAFSPQAPAEGGEVAFQDLSTDETSGIASWQWDFGDGQTSNEASPTHVYADNGDYPVYFTVTNGAGLTDSVAILPPLAVANVPPEITATGDTVNENGVATVSGTITDPGSQDTFTVVIDWGEGAPDTFNYPAGATSYSETHQYLDDNPTGTPSDDYSVTVTVTDDDGGSDTEGTTVTVNNVDPEITATSDTINEDGVATVSGEITDPGILDTSTVEIDWGEGAPETFSYPAGATSYSETHQYLDDNPTATPRDDYSVTVTVTDDDGGSDTEGTTVTVNNVEPVVSIDSITDENGAQVGVDVDVVLVGTAVEVAASFYDDGTLDTHTASIDWGDGHVEDLGPVTGSISATHTYSDPCDCTITLTVTDDDTGPGTATAQIAVVDASGGVNDVIDDLTPYGDDRDVAKAIAKLRGEKGGHASNGALDMLEKDDLNAALEKIKQALEYLEAAEAADPGLDFTNEKGVLSLAGKSVAVGAIEQAEAAAAEPSELQKVQQARDLVAEGDALLAGGDYVGAVGKYEQAARKVQGIA